ncbi:MAG: hypothetical protein CMM55_02130 [Rhodospirillaceae bacterium]|nr:hypothetical protein [Rhodospirillaceae bacterium]
MNDILVSNLGVYMCRFCHMLSRIAKYRMIVRQFHTKISQRNSFAFFVANCVGTRRREVKL